MIASASLASSPASFSTQLARLWTMSRISPSLASSARAVQRIAASSIGTCRSSLIAEASAWPSSGDTSILRMRLAIALLTRPPSRSSSRLSNRSAISRDWRRGGCGFPAPCGRLEEAPGRAGEVDVAHPPRDDRRDQEILPEEIGQRLADAVLVARDDRGVRDRQAERMAEQRGDREPVGQAADHRRLGERLHIAEPGIGRLRTARAAMNTAAITTSRPVAAAFIPAAPGWAGLNRASAGWGRRAHRRHSSRRTAAMSLRRLRRRLRPSAWRARMVDQAVANLRPIHCLDVDREAEAGRHEQQRQQRSRRSGRRSPSMPIGARQLRVARQRHGDRQHAGDHRHGGHDDRLGALVARLRRSPRSWACRGSSSRPRNRPAGSSSWRRCRTASGCR